MRIRGGAIHERLLGGVFRGQRLQPVHPENGHLVFLRFKHRDRRVWAHSRIDPGIQDLGEILRLIGRVLLAHDEKCADEKNGERRGPRPNQAANRPPSARLGFAGRRAARYLRARSVRAVDGEKILRSPSRRAGTALQECAEFVRVAFSASAAALSGNEASNSPSSCPSSSSVEPGGPFFLKRFHKHPSADFAVFCGHKKGATSPCRSSNRAPRRFRDIACLQFPSSK